jgi:hypothetical protein
MLLRLVPLVVLGAAGGIPDVVYIRRRWSVVEAGVVEAYEPAFEINFQPLFTSGVYDPISIVFVSLTKINALRKDIVMNSQ